MRCRRFEAAARREEGEYLHRSSTDEQRRSSLKDLQPCGLSSGGPLAALLLGHRALEAMLPRRALPAARQNSAHPLPIYEMGSSADCQSARRSHTPGRPMSLRYLLLRNPFLPCSFAHLETERQGLLTEGNKGNEVCATTCFCRKTV